MSKLTPGTLITVLSARDRNLVHLPGRSIDDLADNVLFFRPSVPEFVRDHNQADTLKAFVETITFSTALPTEIEQAVTAGSTAAEFARLAYRIGNNLPEIQTELAKGQAQGVSDILDEITTRDLAAVPQLLSLSLSATQSPQYFGYPDIVDVILSRCRLWTVRDAQLVIPAADHFVATTDVKHVLELSAQYGALAVTNETLVISHPLTAYQPSMIEDTSVRIITADAPAPGVHVILANPKVGKTTFVAAALPSATIKKVGEPFDGQNPVLSSLSAYDIVRLLEADDVTVVDSVKFAVFGDTLSRSAAMESGFSTAFANYLTNLGNIFAHLGRTLVVVVNPNIVLDEEALTNYGSMLAGVATSVTILSQRREGANVKVVGRATSRLRAAAVGGREWYDVTNPADWLDSLIAQTPTVPTQPPAQPTNLTNSANANSLVNPTSQPVQQQPVYKRPTAKRIL